jgi:hypothetical protein
VNDERIEKMTRKIVLESLKLIDKTTRGKTGRSRGPCGDEFAARLHDLIKADLTKLYGISHESL